MLEKKQVRISFVPYTGADLCACGAKAVWQTKSSDPKFPVSKVCCSKKNCQNVTAGTDRDLVFAQIATEMKKHILIQFRPKSSYQKDDCINGGCQKKSVLEAIVSSGRMPVAIRCCENNECKQNAEWQARMVVLVDLISIIVEGEGK